MKSIQLGVNIDHVATLRQARGTPYPDPLFAALLAQEAGAHNITLHLREDRRHIQDHDVYRIQENLQIPLNFEMAVTEEMVLLASQLKPTYCCLVPEKREERTTEGGLDVKRNFDSVQNAVRHLQQSGSIVTLFIAPDLHQIETAKAVGADGIEIHTGEYAEASTSAEKEGLLLQIQRASEFASKLGLIVDAGHGLNRQNVSPIAAIPTIRTLNIGHALVADALWVGFSKAVEQMKQLMQEARG